MHPFHALQSECLFSCNFAPGLSHPQPRQVTMVHHAARMRQESTVCFPAPGLPRHLWAGLPLASAKGRGADAGSFHPSWGATNALSSPHRSTYTVCLFLLLRAGPLTPATSSSDHDPPCVTDKSENPSLSPRRQNTSGNASHKSLTD